MSRHFVHDVEVQVSVGAAAEGGRGTQESEAVCVFDDGERGGDGVGDVLEGEVEVVGGEDSVEEGELGVDGGVLGRLGGGDRDMGGRWGCTC